jgi:hypothetical protein
MKECWRNSAPDCLHSMDMDSSVDVSGVDSASILGVELGWMSFCVHLETQTYIYSHLPTVHTSSPKMEAICTSETSTTLSTSKRCKHPRTELTTNHRIDHSGRAVLARDVFGRSNNGIWVRIPLEARMSVYVSYVFVLSCVGSSLPTGLIPRPTACRIVFWLILNGNRPEGLIRQRKK